MIDSFYDGILKLIVALSTGVLGIIPGIEGNEANFINTELYVRNNQIYISTQIENQLNKRIDDIIKTGRKVRLKLKIETFKTGNKKAIASKNIRKEIHYDILNKEYEVAYETSNKISTFTSADEMWVAFLKVQNQPVLRAKDFVEKNATYFLKITAKIETELEIGGRDIDLMLFWNNKAPEYKTNNFDNSIFAF